jgi:cell division septal protein FtsQ
MIRKKRNTTQVDLFAPDDILTKEPPPKVSEKQNIMETIHVTRSFDNPVLMGKSERLAFAGGDTSSDEIKFAHEDDSPPPEVLLPSQKKKQDTNELLRNDPERLIINKDFADGFHSTEEAKRKESSEYGKLQRKIERRKKRQQSRIKKTAVAALLALAVLLLFNWQDWVVNSPLFTLQNIYVQGNMVATKEEILKSADLDLGVRLAEIDLAKVAERITRNPIFKNVAVTRNYPSNIIIHVEERQPFAFIAGDELYAVDPLGYVLPKLRARMIYNLPIISGVRFAPHPGKQLNFDRLHTALDFLKTARDVDESVFYEISEVVINKNNFVLYLNSLPVTFIIDDENFERTVIYLSGVIPYFKQNEIKNIREIDLQYNNQVLVRYNSK